MATGADLAGPSSSGTAELATVTVSSRLPEFWCDQPRLWFIQCEAILKPQKLADEAKFNLVVTKLGKDVITQVSDILLKPPAERKFETLKSRLLTVYEESENRQLQKLLSEVELGDQKPSQLFRHMRDLARGKIPDDTLSIMWQGHLPSSVRAVLAVSDVKDMERLAAIADKVMETARPLQVSEVTNTSSTSDNMAMIQAQIAKLSVQIMELQRSRPRQRGYSKMRHRGNSRSTSRGRHMIPRNPADKDLCYYHRCFRHRAKKCIEPCNWNKTAQPLN